MAIITAYPTSNTAISGTWTNPTNAYVSNGLVVSITRGTVKNSQDDRRYGTYNFDSSIPVGATINSVAIEEQHRVQTTSNVCFLESFATVSGVDGAVNSDGAEPTTLSAVSYPGYARPGGGAWTRTDLLNANFSTVVRARNGNNATSNTWEWDYIRVVVDYTSSATYNETPASPFSTTLTQSQTVGIVFEAVVTTFSGTLAQTQLGGLAVENNTSFIGALSQLQDISANYNNTIPTLLSTNNILQNSNLNLTENIILNSTNTQNQTSILSGINNLNLASTLTLLQTGGINFNSSIIELITGNISSLNNINILPELLESTTTNFNSLNTLNIDTNTLFSSSVSINQIPTGDMNISLPAISSTLNYNSIGGLLSTGDIILSNSSSSINQTVSSNYNLNLPALTTTQNYILNNKLDAVGKQEITSLLNKPIRFGPEYGGTKTLSLAGHLSYYNAINHHPNQSVFVTAVSSNLDTWIVNTTSKTVSRLSPLVPGGNIFSTEWSNDGNYLTVAATGTNKLLVYPWNGTSYGSVTYTDVSGFYNDLALSPNGNWLAVAHSSSIFVLPWNGDGTYGSRIYTSPVVTSNVTHTNWHPSGNYVAFSTAVADPQDQVHIYQWNGSSFGSRVAVPTLPFELNFIRFIKWSPDGNYIFIGYYYYPNLLMYEWTGSGFGARVNIPEFAETLNAQWSPDNSIVTFSNVNMNAYLWDGNNGGLKQNITGTVLIPNKIVTEIAIPCWGSSYFIGMDLQDTVNVHVNDFNIIDGVSNSSTAQMNESQVYNTTSNFSNFGGFSFVNDIILSSTNILNQISNLSRSGDIIFSVNNNIDYISKLNTGGYLNLLSSNNLLHESNLNINLNSIFSSTTNINVLGGLKLDNSILFNTLQIYSNTNNISINSDILFSSNLQFDPTSYIIVLGNVNAYGSTLLNLFYNTNIIIYSSVNTSAISMIGGSKISPSDNDIFIDFLEKYESSLSTDIRNLSKINPYFKEISTTIPVVMQNEETQLIDIYLNNKLYTSVKTVNELTIKLEELSETIGVLKTIHYIEIKK